MNLNGLTSYLTVFSTLKFKDNKAVCGLMNIDRDFKDLEDARQTLKKVNPMLLEAISEENLANFANNSNKHNVAKTCNVS